MWRRGSRFIRRPMAARSAAPLAAMRSCNFDYEKPGWQLTVTRMVLSKGVPLVSDTEKNKDGMIREGLLQTMAQQLKVDTGGAEILRQDPINISETPVGMIAARYSIGTDTRLTQRAPGAGQRRREHLLQI